MATKFSVVLTLAYEDATTRKVTFNGVEDENLSNIKTRVKTLNADMPESFKQTFLSKSGFNCKMISKAQLIATREEIIYSV